MKVCFLVLALVGAISAATPPSSSPTAEELSKRAVKAERAGDIVGAYLLYAEAAAKNPAKTEYWSHAQALRPAAELQMKRQQPEGSTAVNLSAPQGSGEPLDASLFGSISDRELAEARRPLPPQELTEASKEHKDFKLRDKAQALWQQVAAAYKVDVVFDAKYEPASENIRFEIEGVPYKEAFRALEAATDSFAVPEGPHLIYVARDIPVKRVEMEANAAIAIPIPETVSAQEVQEVATAVRGAFEITKLLADTNKRILLMRDRVSKVRPASIMVRDLMQPRAQVMIEVDFLSADDSSSLQYGLTLPTSVGSAALGGLLGRFPMNLIASIPTAFANFLTFGGGASTLGLGITSASLFANVSKSRATTLFHAEMVSVDGQAATLQYGDKYPILSTSYSAGTGAALGYTPSFNFEDLGLTLKITPHVVGVDTISLEVDAEYKLLGTDTYNGIPGIANRKYQSKVTVDRGQWALIAGLMSGTDSRSISGLPGLIKIPFLSNVDNEHTHSDVIIVLKPHLLGLPPSETVPRDAWVGSETRPRTEL